ncbi:MAG: NmrA/HSCARG family protein [Candidatus Eisenbacteria bacterium]|uniref:NmrA/HSCARG family protein n=1 Tax=Eiseniibacteriota bacterium TaxID=2212470 RepID=A0A538T951_UNCEI|nr:MAG: NmrA/HSCARG family protein [Candidatus Eisenbacteria bacterium]
MSDRIVLVTGATGRQGGAVARSLVGKGFKLRGMTRKPEGEPAKALKVLGIEVVRADLDDADSVAKALDGAWGVFAVQNTWEAGVEREEQQGKRLAELARSKGVQHFVYSSVASAHRKTGIPHFDNKWRVEEVVRRLKFPSHAILRPVFFMENLFTPSFLMGDRLVAALKPTTPLQMVAVDDIGRVGARLFTDSEELEGREIDLGGDSATMVQAAQALSRGLSKPIRFVEIPIAEVRKNSEDVARMLEWFERVGYNADIPALEREFGKLTKLEEWAARAVHA